MQLGPAASGAGHIQGRASEVQLQRLETWASALSYRATRPPSDRLLGSPWYVGRPRESSPGGLGRLPELSAVQI